MSVLKASMFMKSFRYSADRSVVTKADYNLTKYEIKKGGHAVNFWDNEFNIATSHKNPSVTSHQYSHRVLWRTCYVTLLQAGWYGNPWEANVTSLISHLIDKQRLSQLKNTAPLFKPTPTALNGCYHDSFSFIIVFSVSYIYILPLGTDDSVQILNSCKLSAIKRW